MSVESLSKDTKAIGVLALTVALVMLILGQFTGTTGITSAANTSINSFITGLGAYASWVGIIILIGVAAYLFVKMKKAF